jgi:hypothetical protein
MNHLNQIRNEVFAAVVRQHLNSRAAVRSALIAEVAARGLTGLDARFVASWGMSAFGYGGGI